MKKWIKILLVTLGIIAVLVVTTILLLPPIAKNYLEKHSKELVGRQITIEKLMIPKTENRHPKRTAHRCDTGRTFGIIRNRLQAVRLQ